MPEGSIPATPEHIEAAAEATIVAAAITLETVQAAIEAEGQAAEDRQEELLEEVRKCLAKLEALSTLLERGAESPSLQQLLLQVGQMQTAVEAIQADLTAWKQSRQSSHASIPITKERNGEIVPGPQNEEPLPANEPSRSSESTEASSPPRSNQSATPAPSSKKRRYVRI